MKRDLLLCAWCLCAATALAQPRLDEWNRAIAAGDRLVRTGDYAAAVPLYREALHIAESFGIEDIYLAASLDYLGTVYNSLGMWLDSEQQYHRAMKIVESSLGRENITYGLLLLDLGTMYGNSGRYYRAEPPVREALAIFMRILPANDTHTALARVSYAGAILARHQYHEAEELLRQAIPVLEGSDSTRIAAGSAWNSLGMVTRAQGRPAEANRMFQTAVQIVESSVGTGHPALLVPLTNLAASYGELGQATEAEAAYLSAISLCERKLGADHPAYGRILGNYAEFLRAQHRKSDAKKVAAQSQSALRASARRSGAGMTVDIAAFRQ